jgi:hypothetical protein
MFERMMDTHEANLPIENDGGLEETKTPEVTDVVTEVAPEVTEVVTEVTPESASEEVAEPQEDAAPVVNGKLTKEEILAKLTELVNGSVETARNEIELLKQAFYKINRFEVDELKKAFLEGGGEEEDFQPPADETEGKIKELLTAYREKKASQHSLKCIYL